MYDVCIHDTPLSIHIHTSLANLNVRIDQVGGVAMIRPATTLYLLKLLGEPGGVPSLSIKPHKDDAIDLQ